MTTTNQLWLKLRGIFCIYKPAMLAQRHAKQTIIQNLLNDLNEKFVPPKENLVLIEGSTASEMEVKVTEKMATHPLAIGDGFWERDIKLNFINYLAPTSSGLCLVGINKGVRYATLLKHSNLMRTYRISGVLGKSTTNLHIDGRVVERSTYSHVKYHHLEKLMMKIQAIHQKKAMQFLHLDMESQEAYEALAEEGLVRPRGESHPLAYSLKCVEFEPPNFTIEIDCINEDEYFLRKVAHDLGLLMKTNATASKIRCIRYGPLTVDDALLRKHWRLEHIIDNIEYIRDKNLMPESHNLERIEDTSL